MGGLSFLQLCSSLLSLLSFFLRISIAVDTLTPNQSISDGRNTLISAGGSFELGFFSPGNSKNRYLGIWYKKISTGTVVWVANREIPLTDSSGVLKFTDQGILILVNRSESIIWSSNSSRVAHNPVVQLLESGNLIVKDENNNNNPEEENSFWQSFDYPCDTFLAGMKLGFNLKTGLNRYMSSWKSNDDPSPGDYRYGLDPNGIPQLKLWKGSVVQYRAGTWNGVRFSGKPELKANPIYTFNFISNQNETYYTYRLINNSIVTRMVINSSGSVQRVTWVDQTKGWILLLMVPRDYCDTYALCGPYGSCNINNSPVCGCLKGFIPKSQDAWDRMDWSDGCIRKTPISCEKAGVGFLRYQGVKLPDTLVSWINRSMSLKECEVDCLNNCSCMAYANSDVTGGGSGCLLWFGDLIDNRVFSNVEGQDIYIRMASSELGGKLEFTSGSSDKKKKVLLIVTGVVLVTVMLFSGLICYLKKIRKVANRGGKMSQREDLELPLFDFIEITNATNNFSDDNKLGVGGFGPVYRAKLAEGQEIAVKRLCKHSGQGMQEFKNEVKLIAKLQHRNLVKLLGCCIHKEEKMLIYEYMPNKSLNCFIFDETRRTMLDWQKRYKIINGIARGLLYLHQDSRLRIIHRDLKASNILLDKEMNPKIADFGLARTFGGDQTAAKTRRVVGTYGYMSPEYAIDGIFSIKSDVFSFGVLVLEIVSGKKNRGFCHPDHNLNLLGHAWKLWKEGKTSELIDALMEESYNLHEALRCIQVGLLCVQQHPQDRPSMSSVVLMLGSESAILPQPKQPGFFTERNPVREELSSTNQESCSINEITVTLLEAR